MEPLVLALDANAFNFLHSLGLLDDLVRLATPPDARVELHSTSYVVRFELNSHQCLIADLENRMVFRVHALVAGSTVFQKFRKLVKEGYDKGESELMNLGELVVELVVRGLLSEETAADRVAPWERSHAQMGKPKDWESLSAALERKRGR